MSLNRLELKHTVAGRGYFLADSLVQSGDIIEVCSPGAYLWHPVRFMLTTTPQGLPSYQLFIGNEDITERVPRDAAFRCPKLKTVP